MLLDITADGVIDESEKPELDEVVKKLGRGRGNCTEHEALD